MSLIEQQVRRAKVRLNSNVLLERLALGVVVAAVLWSVVLLLERVFALGLPLTQRHDDTVAFGVLLVLPARSRARL